MKIKSIAAAGALGVGLGLAGLMGAGTASAQPCSDSTDPGYTPPLTPARVACVTNEQIGEFLRTASPQYNLDVLINGTADDSTDSGRSGLGLIDQPTTFIGSIVGEGGFLDGPRSPELAPPSANGF